MATAHLLHGFLGAGKTTFAKALERRCNGVRFTHDEWMRALYGEDPPEAEFADAAARVHRLMEQVWRQCLVAGVDIILDTGLWSRAERDRIRAVVADVGAEAVLYQLHCDEALAHERLTARNAAPHTGLYIAPETYALLRARFEPLADDELRIDIDTNGTV
ncbi:putative kinase [Rhizomicrobium palustre]|uniref:Putative kinase n=1 Tax=Rhizomicrobium palustre TaxID=189966 RepID=A0A846N0C4_9PROT|nr:AAA family ATPase [Rhizomicrobium palustre]NIK88702.1 putative kinase [Rhizomicrobium palustre]